jgi:hypothetical protein
MIGPLEIDQFEVGFGNAALGASPVFRHIGPSGTSGNAVFRSACGLVVHKTANDADVCFESRSAHGVLSLNLEMIELN